MAVTLTRLKTREDNLGNLDRWVFTFGLYVLLSKEPFGSLKAVDELLEMIRIGILRSFMSLNVGPKLVDELSIVLLETRSIRDSVLRAIDNVVGGSTFATDSTSIRAKPWSRMRVADDISKALNGRLDSCCVSSKTD